LAALVPVAFADHGKDSSSSGTSSQDHRGGDAPKGMRDRDDENGTDDLDGHDGAHHERDDAADGDHDDHDDDHEGDHDGRHFGEGLHGPKTAYVLNLTGSRMGDDNATYTLSLDSSGKGAERFVNG